MKKLIAIAVLAASVAGCVEQEDKGIGVIPLDGAKVSGTIVEAAPDSGVLLKTDGGRTALLPDQWEYKQGDQVMGFEELQPGLEVTAYAPSGDGRLVAAPGKNLVVSTGDDTFALPMEAFPAQSRQIPVKVQTYGGQTRVLPLQEAVYSPDGLTILSHPAYSNYAFPVAEQYAYSRAYPVGFYDNQTLALVPGQGTLQAVALPPTYYPTNALQTNQPVRFTYYDNNVGVTSWNSLQDGQIDLSDILLAGTLLQVLDGNAVIEVGSRPFTVPRSYVYVDNGPVVWNTIQPGAPVNVRYYPGVYNLVDYSDDIMTCSYNNQLVQVPMDYVPDYVYQQPIVVRLNDGPYRRLPFGQAKKLLRSRSARLVIPPGQQKHWQSWNNSRTYTVVPGFDNYVLYGAPGHQRIVPRGDGDDRNWANRWNRANAPVVFGAAAPRVRTQGHGKKQYRVKGIPVVTNYAPKKAKHDRRATYSPRGRGHAAHAAPRQTRRQHVDRVSAPTRGHRVEAQPHRTVKRRQHAAPTRNSRSYAPKGNSKHASRAPQARRATPRHAGYQAPRRSNHRAAVYRAPQRSNSRAAVHRAPRRSNPRAATQRAPQHVNHRAAPQRLAPSHRSGGQTRGGGHKGRR